MSIKRISDDLNKIVQSYNKPKVAGELTPSAVAEINRIDSTVARIKKDFEGKIASQMKKMNLPSYMMDDVRRFSDDLKDLQQLVKWLREKAKID